MSAKLVAALSPDKVEKERVKKQRQAEAARMRYLSFNFLRLHSDDCNYPCEVDSQLR